MQGTGRTGPFGDYIHYVYDGGNWVHINNPYEFTDAVKERYSQLGITDFTGFENLALAHPEQANYEVVQHITGARSRVMEPWRSIAVRCDDPLVPFDTTGVLYFKNGYTPDNTTSMIFSVDDCGWGRQDNSCCGGSEDYWIDIYIGEGKAAYQEWINTGDNRCLDISY